MSGREKRVDLRFGGFACSLRGFDDPVEPLTRVLREVQATLAERAPGTDAPLFDEATLRRLEAEIASACEGGVSAMPGLVLTMSEAEAPVETPAVAADEAEMPVAAPEPEMPAAEPMDEIAAAEPEAVDAELRAALTHGQEHPETTIPPGGVANLFTESEPSDDVEEGAADGVNLFGEPESVDTAAADGPRTAAPSVAADLPEEAQPSEPADAPAGEPEGAEPDWAAAAEPTNLFEAPGDEDAADATGANLFLEDAEPTLPPGGEAAPDESVDTPLADENVTPLDSFRDRNGFDAPASTAERELPRPRASTGISAADLAKRAGASATPELLAAAAAWLTVVKGHGSFTRREVLDVFEQLPGDHAKNPEAKIKGFGKLVRSGQVRLGSDDRFQLSDAERDRFEDVLG